MPDSPIKLTLEALAQNFGRQLRKELTLSDVQSIAYRNATEPIPSICHSHDFTDANEVMNAAWQATYPRHPFDLHNEAHCDHWSAAWTLAKQQQFGLPPKLQIHLPATRETAGMARKAPAPVRTTRAGAFV